MSDDTTTIEKDAAEKTIHAELFEAASADKSEKFKGRGKSETLADYLARLVERIAEVPQEVFDTMSQEAQTWYNEAVDLLNEEKELPVPPGMDIEGETEVKSSTRKAPAKGKADKAEKKAKEPKAKKEKVVKVPKEKLVGLARVRPREGASIGRTIRAALIEDQSLSADDLRAALDKAGFKDVNKSTISTMTADILRTLYVAADMGKFEPNPPMKATAAD